MFLFLEGCIAVGLIEAAQERLLDEPLICHRHV